MQDAWLMPPDKFKQLDDEFHFTFDPCPCPKPEGYDSTVIEWGQSNFVNPPFHRENGIGPTAFMKKAIVENKKGKTVVLVAPTQSYVNLMLDAGAELRSMGRIRWLHKDTKEPCKDPSPITAFILRSRPAHASSRRIERETDVIEAAKTWWMMHRPVTYSSQEHLANPDINCPTKADGFLARAVAALLRGEQHG